MAEGDWHARRWSYQFNTVHAITADARGNFYVGDRGNRRIKVHDTDLNLKAMFTNVGAPWSVCVTPGEKQYLYSGDSNGKIYKLDLDGKLLGWAQISRNQVSDKWRAQEGLPTSQRREGRSAPALACDLPFVVRPFAGGLMPQAVVSRESTRRRDYRAHKVSDKWRAQEGRWQVKRRAQLL